MPQPTQEAVQRMVRVLGSFGWTCTDEFWERYHSDPWVFNLANAVEAQSAQYERDRQLLRDRIAELMEENRELLSGEG